MQDELIMYVRNKKLTPIGATYFKRTSIDVNGVEIVTMGWSKACKTDVFTKKTGREIAVKRSVKAVKWLVKAITIDNTDVANHIRLDSEEYINNTQTVPYAIKNNIKYYLDSAKDALGIEGDAIFIVPVLEKFVDITVAMMKTLSSSDADINLLDSDTKRATTRTRYISILY